MGHDAADRLDRVEALLAAQQRRIDALEADNARLRQSSEGPTPLPSGNPVASDAPLGRRRLLVGGATAGAVAVAGVVATGTPAAAANGDAMILGQSNSATAETKLVYGSSGNNGFRVEGTTSLALVESFQGGTAAAVKGANTGSGIGVSGLSNAGPGVSGESSGDHGVIGTSTSPDRSGVRGVASGGGSIGVSGETEDGLAGVFGSSPGLGVYGTSYGPTGAGVQGIGGGRGVQGLSYESGTGVYGSTQTGSGVVGESDSGVGVVAVGGLASLRLSAPSARSAPTSDSVAHVVGDVVTDTDGNQWVCVTAGTPGSWRKTAGPATAGQLHILSTPVRVYDSRPGTAPAAVGPKTPLVAATNRTLDLKAATSGVPAGASAVLLNLLAVNVPVSTGNALVWANGAAKPFATSVVWTATVEASRFSALVVTKVDSLARCQVSATATIDVAVDVVGYYL